MRLIRSLSGRLLTITIIVVMVTEVAIFVPSVARFREDYLLERVRRAEIAALTVLASERGRVSQQLQSELIEKAEVLNIVVGRQGIRELVLSSPGLGPVDATYDLRNPMIYDLIGDALARIVKGDTGIIRIRAYASADMGEDLEITVRSGPLHSAMVSYAFNIFWLSLAIALIAAAMVFFAMRALVVRPITEVITNVKDFSENPEDASRIIEPASRVGEIAEAERAVAEMERQVHGALKARARLASLGEAVAKISHDLRNILATTQLMADRLEMSEDPIVARTAPKLIASLDRAIRLCQSTLTYGRAEEHPPETRLVSLGALVEEVVEGLGLIPDERTVMCRVDIDPEIVVEADPEQLYRVLNNLGRNAAAAIRSTGKPGELCFEAEAREDAVAIVLSDTGPGMPSKAMEHLFKPFQGSTSREGTGLGLAIADELVRANGGELVLVSSTTSGTVFRITLPGRNRSSQEIGRMGIALAFAPSRR